MKIHAGSAPRVRHWEDPQPCTLLGTGHALPREAVDTESLLERVRMHFGIDVVRSGRVIARRLNIESRHIARALAARIESPHHDCSNAELAAHAVHSALANAGLEVRDLKYLIAHTASPGQLIPPNVSRVADLLEYDGPFMELRQACTGFANSLIVARGLLASLGQGPIAIVGSETGSVFFDPARVADDHGQLVNLLQMGDGAGACIVAPNQATRSTISHVFFGNAGRGKAPGFQMHGGSDSPQLSGAVLEFEHNYAAVRESGPVLFRSGIEAATALGIDIDDMDYIVPHQANGNMAELIANGLGVDRDRVFVNANRVGNTGSAAIWLALDELRSQMSRGERALILGAEATKHFYGGFVYTHR